MLRIVAPVAATLLTAGVLVGGCRSNSPAATPADSQITLVSSSSPTPDVTILNRKLVANGQPTVPPGTDVRAPRRVDPTVNAMAEATRLAAVTRAIAGQRLTCGPASDRDGPIARSHGVLGLNCRQFGDFWVVVTESSVVAVYHCASADAPCLAGREPDVPGEWRISAEHAYYRYLTFVPPDKLQSFINKSCFSLTSLTYAAPEDCVSPTPSPALDSGIASAATPRPSN